MGGRSSSEPQQQAAPNPNAYPGGVSGPTFTMQPALPGQLDAIAAQLAMGYGQSQPGILAHLNSLYQPMVLPDYSNRAGASFPTPSANPSASQAGNQHAVERDWNAIGMVPPQQAQQPRPIIDQATGRIIG